MVVKKTTRNFEKFHIADRVMKEIHSKNIKMRPHWHFVAKSLLIKALFLTVLGIAIYFLNLSIFKFRIYDPFGFLVFGKLGLAGFIHAVPWRMSIVAIFSSIVGIKILRVFDISYKKNFAMLTLGLLLFVVSGSFAVDKTGINEQLKKSGKVPLLYQGNYIAQDWVMGEVEKVDAGKKQLILLIPFQKKEVTVVWKEDTFFPTGKDFSHGTFIQVVGVMEKDSFKAKGIVKRGIRTY